MFVFLFLCRFARVRVRIRVLVLVLVAVLLMVESQVTPTVRAVRIGRLLNPLRQPSVHRPQWCKSM